MGKLGHLRESFEKLSIDGMLITKGYNRRYMTNFTGSAGVVLVSKTKAVFITDFRYMEQAAKQATDFEIVQHKTAIIEEIAKQVAELGITKLGFEQDTVTYATYEQYKKAIHCELVPTSAVVEDLRVIKTPEEIKIIQTAADIADAAFKHIIEYIRPGLTEIEVSNELEFFMRKQGATSSSFDIIVASGLRSALPHGVASNKVIQTGEFVTLDYGAYFDGYVSDITRTIAVGNVSDELKNIYDIVLAAQLRGLEGLKAGITTKEADALTRDYITEKGYGEQYGHGTGHGIGLEIHEEPSLSFRTNTILKPNMVVTVEPGIYVAGLGGVRIEDDTVVTEAGNNVLTHSPKQLITL